MDDSFLMDDGDFFGMDDVDGALWSMGGGCVPVVPIFPLPPLPLTCPVDPFPDERTTPRNTCSKEVAPWFL